MSEWIIQSIRNVTALIKVLQVHFIYSPVAQKSPDIDLDQLQWSVFIGCVLVGADPYLDVTDSGS